MKINGHFLIPPTLADTFENLSEDIGDKLRVMTTGQIVAYDSARRTASVLIGETLKLANGTVVPVPAPLLDVPVVTLQGGGVHVAFPIIPGDECLVIFNDFNIDNWFTNGGQQLPADQRQHDLSDGFAIVGPNTLANPLLTLLSATEGGLSTETAKIALDTVTGKATIQAGGQNLAIVLANLLTSLGAAFTALSSDPGLQPATQTAAAAAATAATTAITLLAEMLQ